MSATMGKNKHRQSIENDDVDDESQLLRRTRQRAKVQSIKQDDSSSIEEEAVLPSKTKTAPKARKNAAVSESPENSTEAPDTSLAPHLRKRKGGNKRRFTHEYCLTCRHYGRACSGRREGQDGCSICRDPNREKGEKLRECLWANPDAGIHTYEEARVVHKEAQVERRARDKAKSREQRANAKNQLGLKVSVGQGPPPPVTRQLDVVPPPSATSRTPNFYTAPVLKNQNDDIDTITVSTSPVVHHPSISYIPNVNGDSTPKTHNRPMIKLRVNGPSDRKSVGAPTTSQPSPAQPVRPVPQLPPAPRQLSFMPPPIPRVPPYYDHQIQAWRYPSQPCTYLAPSDIPTAAYPAYESAYGHPPAFTKTASSPIAPLSNGASSAPKTMTRPLDKSGTPCKKWARTGSDVATVSGSSSKMKGRKADDADGDQTVTNGTRDDSSTSDLSSVIDVDDPSEFEKAVRYTGSGGSPEASPWTQSIVVRDDPEYVMIHNNDAGDETRDEEEPEELDEEDEEEDRLQAQINRMVRENAKKSVTQATIPSKLDVQVRNNKTTSPGATKVTTRDSTSKRTTSSTALRNRGKDSDESSTDEEGPLKKLPPEIRNKLSRTATTHIRISDTETITIRPEHFKSEALRNRSHSRSVDGESADLRPRTGGKNRSQPKNANEKRGHNSMDDDDDIAIKTEDEYEEGEEEEEGEDGESEGQDVDMEDA